jgi:hypothetical protein
MTESVEGRIAKDLKKSGFVAELHTGQALQRHGWRVAFGETYLDRDDGKSREIDIEAYRVFNDEGANLQVVMNLYVEVKQASKYPWTVFMTRDSLHAYGWTILHAGQAYMKKGGAPFTTAMTTEPMSRSDKKVGTAFHEAFRHSEAPSTIYKALMSACKAAFHHQANWGESDENRRFEPDRRVVLEFFVPLIVVAGQLFEVHLVDDDIEARPGEWLPIKLNYSSPQYRDGEDVLFHPYLTSLTSIETCLVAFDKWFDILSKGFSTAVVKCRSK